MRTLYFSLWFLSSSILWSPYGIGRPYIFSSCFFFFFLLSSFFSSPNLISSYFFPRLISAVADWMSTIGLLAHSLWYGLSANLRCRSETCYTGLAQIQDAKSRQKIAFWAPSHNFVWLYLRNKGMHVSTIGKKTC